MKKRIISLAVMCMMGLALMPVTVVKADQLTKDLTLTGDVSQQYIVPNGYNIVLDLAGYNISYEGGSAIIVETGGTLKIVDSGKGAAGSKTYGTVSASGAIHSPYAAVSTMPGSYTDIEGGTFTSNCWYAVKNLGTMLIDGNPTFVKTATDTASVVVNGWYGTTGNTNDTIEGAIVDYATNAYVLKNPNYQATMTINSGTFTGNGKSALAADTGIATTQSIGNQIYGNITINGGSFTKSRYTLYNAGTAVINGGSFTGTKAAVYNGDSTETPAAVGNLTINGGSFTSEGVDWAVQSIINDDGTSSLYDGTFTGTIKNSTTTGNSLTIYGGTYTESEDTLKTFLTPSATYQSGVVATKAVTTISKYVLYTSNPGTTNFTYSLTNVNNNQTGDTVVQKASTGTNGQVYEEVRDGITYSKVKITLGDSDIKTLPFTVGELNNGKDSSQLVALNVANPNGNEKYYAKNFKLDFTDVEFKNPGIYRYVLRETSDNAKVLTSGTLFFDVWVNRKSSVYTDDDYKNLIVTAVIAHTDSALSTTGNAVNTKTSILTSVCVQKSMDITVKHYSIGNQASKTENYKYTLTLKNATKGSTISYLRSNKSTGTFTVMNDGTSSYDFYLKDKEAITFLNISEYPGYSVIADETTMKSEGLTTATKIEDFQSADNLKDSITAVTQKTSLLTTADVKTSTDTTNEKAENSEISVNNALADSISKTDSMYIVSDTYLQSDSTIVYSIYKQGVIPTGVILSVAPYAVVVLAGFFGLIVFAVKRRNRDEEEDA